MSDILDSLKTSDLKTNSRCIRHYTTMLAVDLVSRLPDEILAMIILRSTENIMFQQLDDNPAVQMLRAYPNRQIIIDCLCNCILPKSLLIHLLNYTIKTPIERQMVEVFRDRIPINYLDKYSWLPFHLKNTTSTSNQLVFQPTIIKIYKFNHEENGLPANILDNCTYDNVVTFKVTMLNDAFNPTTTNHDFIKKLSNVREISVIQNWQYYDWLVPRNKPHGLLIDLLKRYSQQLTFVKCTVQDLYNPSISNPIIHNQNIRRFFKRYRL